VIKLNQVFTSLPVARTKKNYFALFSLSAFSITLKFYFYLSVKPVTKYPSVSLLIDYKNIIFEWILVDVKERGN
jgi:hypothetical protein